MRGDAFPRSFVETIVLYCHYDKKDGPASRISVEAYWYCDNCGALILCDSCGEPWHSEHADCSEDD